MTLQVGKPAPQIDHDAYRRGTPDAFRVTSEELEGRWVVLFFYPRDFTFVCPTELAGFAELSSAFDAEDADVVAASTDSYYSHAAWFESHRMLGEVDYPVLADTAHDLARAYGVLTDDGSALRGTFVIDPQGVLRHASVSDQSVGRSPGETLRVLQALRTGELCPVNWRPGQPTLQLAA
jgi:peroxiredoxin (alkyl hydroperoxide reductase subunit C)